MLYYLLLSLLLWALADACQTPFYPTGILLWDLRTTSFDTILLAEACNISSWDPLTCSAVKKATIDLDTRTVSRGWPDGYTDDGPQETHHDFSEYTLTFLPSSDGVKITHMVSGKSTSLPAPGLEVEEFRPFNYYWFVSEKMERVYFAYYRSGGIATVIGPLPGQSGDALNLPYDDTLEASYNNLVPDGRLRPIENVQMVYMATYICGGSYAWYNETTLVGRSLNGYDFFGGFASSLDGKHVYKANHTYNPESAIVSYSITKIHWASDDRESFLLDEADVLALFDEDFPDDFLGVSLDDSGCVASTPRANMLLVWCVGIMCYCTLLFRIALNTSG